MSSDVNLLPQMPSLRILLLCHSFNSLSQRLFTTLKAQGHTVSVELDISDTVTQEAVTLFSPDVLIAPFLKRRIPQSVWQQVPCWIVHPGPPGDQGPNALDWALLEGVARWGVTVLQATADFDAGPVWASSEFDMRQASKGSLYRCEVAEGAETAILQALHAFQSHPQKAVPSTPLGSVARWRGLVKQADRAIDWARMTTAEVLARINSADGQPGVQDALFDETCRIWDGHGASNELMDSLAQLPAGSVQGTRDGALLRRTVDGGVWIGQALCETGQTDSAQERPPFKLPCTLLFEKQLENFPTLPTLLMRDGHDEWGELHYSEVMQEGVCVGYLAFDFYNGAMSTRQCKALSTALAIIRQRKAQVLVVLGGQDFFSNGIHLNCIEAASHGLGEEGVGSAAQASWNNINAMDDAALALITLTDRIVISALRGNAGAGGAFLALAADEVWAHRGVLLNPHYKNMGNLYGSEYWTYLLPQRLGADSAKKLMQQRLPISAAQAQNMGLIDHHFDCRSVDFLVRVRQRVDEIIRAGDLLARIARKQEKRATDEALRPLSDFRDEELGHMHRNFYGFDPSYHIARYHFVHKLAHAWTPRHLALHR